MKSFFLSFFFLSSLNLFCQNDDPLKNYEPSVKRNYEFLISYTFPVSDPPKTSSDYYYVLSQKLNANDFNEALNVINRIIEIDLYEETGNDPRGVSLKYLERASIRYNLEQYFEAMQDCNKAMKIDTFVFGKHEDAYSLRAHCKAKLGDVNGALRDLEKIQIVPIYSQFGTPPEIPFWKAYYQLKVGNNKEILSKASSNLATALFIKPEFPEAHFLKGIILYKEGYIQGACNEWSIAGESGYKAAYNLIKKHCQN